MAQKSGESNKNWISYGFFKKKPCSNQSHEVINPLIYQRLILYQPRT